MANEIKIIGDNSNEMCICNIIFENDVFSAKIFLKSDWYEANVDFTASTERLNEFSKNIDEMLKNNSGTANFINDNGNFDLDIIMDETTGKIKLSGILIKDMMDEARLEYVLESDYQSLVNFQAGLKNMLF